MISDEDDRYLRAYARRLHADHGEDAYHAAICELLTNGKEAIRNIRGLCIVMMKRALCGMFRHQTVDARQSAAWLKDEPVGAQYGSLIKKGRLLTHCRRYGHPLVEGNLAYVNRHRTCLTCKRLNSAASLQRKKSRLADSQ